MREEERKKSRLSYHNKLLPHILQTIHQSLHQNFLITGDFNADCRYLSNTNYHRTDLWTDDRFYFLVNTAADTTANHNTNCAYDRSVCAPWSSALSQSESTRLALRNHFTYEVLRKMQLNEPDFQALAVTILTAFMTGGVMCALVLSTELV